MLLSDLRRNDIRLVFYHLSRTLYRFFAKSFKVFHTGQLKNLVGAFFLRMYIPTSNGHHFILLHAVSISCCRNDNLIPYIPVNRLRQGQSIIPGIDGSCEVSPCHWNRLACMRVKIKIGEN